MKKIFLFILFGFQISMAFAQSSAIQLLHDLRDVHEGQLVAFVAHDGDRYYPMSSSNGLTERDFDYSPVALSNPKKSVSYNTYQDAVLNSMMFRVVRLGNRYVLYDTLHQLYLINDYQHACLMNDAGVYPDSYLGLHVDEKVDKGGVSHQWTLGKRHLVKAAQYTFASDDMLAANSYVPCELYALGDTVIAYYVSENRTLKTNYSIPSNLFAFYRTFKADTLNTAAFPFDVPNYQNVFGFQCQAYEPEVVDENHVNFRKVSPNATLKKFVPYLMMGHFFDPPFMLPNTEFFYQIESDALHLSPYSGIYFMCTTVASDIAGQDCAFVKDGKLYNSQNAVHVRLKPYRWYIDNSKRVCAKEYRLTVEDEDLTSAVTAVTVNAGKNSPVYNLQGMRIAGSLDELPSGHGVFVCGGKKVIR